MHPTALTHERFFAALRMTSYDLIAEAYLGIYTYHINCVLEVQNLEPFTTLGKPRKFMTRNLS